MPPAILMRYLCPHSSLNKVPLVRIADLSWCNLLTLRVWYPSFPSWCVYCPLRKVSTVNSSPTEVPFLSLQYFRGITYLHSSPIEILSCRCSPTEVPLENMQSYRGASRVHAVLLWCHSLCACSLTEVPLVCMQSYRGATCRPYGSGSPACPAAEEGLWGWPLAQLAAAVSGLASGVLPPTQTFVCFR